MSGNIVIVTPPPNDDHEASPSAFWLQRKIGKTAAQGLIRLGYKLRLNDDKDKHSATSSSSVGGCWELETDPMGRQTIVAVYMLHSSVLDQQTTKNSATKEEKMTSTRAMVSPLDELSALQMVANYNNSTESAHVVGTNLIATCSQHVYAILPYHRDGNLSQFCQTVGNLEEPLARYIFRQIVKGLKTLQDVGLCHRNLSLDALQMDRDHVDICELGWALRFNKNAPADEDRPLPPPGGLDLRYCAPEYFGSTTGVWNGFSADLWAAGLMLYNMIFGEEALFVAPIAEDKLFARLCIKGDVRGMAKRCGKFLGKDFSGLSDELADLLKNMLRADPKQRLSLEQVMEHPWLTMDEVETPTEWTRKNQSDLMQTKSEK